MDLATIIGLIVVVGLILMGIMLGSPLIIFFDMTSVLIVGLGSIFILFVAYPASEVKSMVSAMKKAFKQNPKKSEELLTLMRQMSTRARREGVLALEDVARTLDDEFLKRGIQMVVDGHDPEAIEDVLYSELDKIEERHKVSIGLMEYMGGASPALGMIGTLIGLVQMLANISDPKKIGPAMAVALLTTFYGSILANLVFTPCAGKLKARTVLEVLNLEIVFEGAAAILDNNNPMTVYERLSSYIPAKKRAPMKRRGGEEE